VIVAHPLYHDVNNWKVGDEVTFDGRRASVVGVQFLSANILLTLLLPDGDEQTVSFVNVKKIGPLVRLAAL
jgi:hypothetical protein